MPKAKAVALSTALDRAIVDLGDALDSDELRGLVGGEYARLILESAVLQLQEINCRLYPKSEAARLFAKACAE
jgi:hypothetical protein